MPVVLVEDIDCDDKSLFNGENQEGSTGMPDHDASVDARIIEKYLRPDSVVMEDSNESDSYS